ncbi:hypothetical protein [Deinococcus arcticus]|uniref:Nitroreductase domain-containing protein n=1 Tax=Deinococcus arcticus TaxID=2136176 RepID=A0A2T3W4Y7_9DEIO|nr:hypothetical protein [Deinococcus arcticus]PTA66965.1 hypothetical protein C8263_14705 [Deinococcus arcticus]
MTLTPLHALEQSYLKQVGPARPGQPPHLDAYPADAPLQPDWAALDRPEEASFWARLGTLLRLAATPLRVEPHATYNPHRAYPSPRALYAAHVALESAQGRWLLDPHRACWRRLGPAPFTPPCTATLHLLGHLPTVPDSYGALRPTLAALEAGHLLGALRHLGEGLGLRLPGHPGATPPDLGPDWWPLQSLAVEEGPADARQAALAWADLQARSSGPGPFGLLTDRQPADVAPFAAALQEPGTVLLAQHLTGLAPGVYSADGPLPLPAPALADALQNAYSYPDDLNVTALNAAVLLTATYHPAHPFLPTQLALGEQAQRLCLALARAGLFARPVRAYREAPLDSLLNLPAHQTVAYALLCGRAPLHDLSLPLLRRTA